DAARVDVVPAFFSPFSYAGGHGPPFSLSHVYCSSLSLPISAFRAIPLPSRTRELPSTNSYSFIIMLIVDSLCIEVPASQFSSSSRLVVAGPASQVRTVPSALRLRASVWPSRIRVRGPEAFALFHPPNYSADMRHGQSSQMGRRHWAHSAFYLT